MYFRLYRSTDLTAGNACLIRREFVLIRYGAVVLHWRRVSPSTLEG